MMKETKDKNMAFKNMSRSVTQAKTVCQASSLERDRRKDRQGRLMGYVGAHKNMDRILLPYTEGEEEEGQLS